MIRSSRPRNIGTITNYQVDNDVSIVTKSRNLGTIQYEFFKQEYYAQDNMGGDGFMDIVRGIYNQGKKGAEFILKNKDKISDAYSGEIGNTIRNLIPSNDDLGRDGFAGERHMILELPNGKNGVANYMGPGTQVVKRLKRGDKGRTKADTVAKRHDIDYSLAKGAENIKDQYDQIRKADKRMVNSLRKIQSNRGDASRNVQAGMRLIQAKNIAEDAGVISRGKFAGKLDKISPEDKNILLANRDLLTQKGYGKSASGKPADKLKKKLIKAHSKNKLIHGQSRGQTFPSTKPYVLSPKPLVGSGILSKVLLTDIIPSLTKHLGLSSTKLPKVQIKKVLNMGGKNKSVGQTINLLSKYLIPILTQMKIKKMKGKGLSGAGIKKLLAHKGNSLKLHKLLKIALMKEIHSKINPKGISGGKIRASKKGEFWKDFKKGFTQVFKPFSKVFGPVAKAVGVPELGIPVEILGDLL